MKFVFLLVFLHRAILPNGQIAECTTLTQPDVYTSFHACEVERAKRHYGIPYSKYKSDVSTSYCISVDEVSAAKLYSTFRLPFVGRTAALNK